VCLLQACGGSLLRRPAASSSVAKRSIASSATIDAAVISVGGACAAFVNAQYRKRAEPNRYCD
jgi:hypothetical protein